MPFGLPVEEFDTYLKNDNMLDHLKDQVEDTELGLKQADELRKKLEVLQGRHNNLKGRYFEQEILLKLINLIISGKGGIVQGIKITDFNPEIGYLLPDGEEIDVVLEGKNSVIMVECKNYLPRYLYKITEEMIDKFIEKAVRLHQKNFQEKELRVAFFSKHGFENKIEQYLESREIVSHLSKERQGR